MKSFLSCFFYPTTLVCVDDDLSFLKWLSTFLEERNPVQSFHDPLKACEFLKSATQTAKALPDLGSYAGFDDYVQSIHTLIYVPNRFEDISTVIVDYAMPAWDGLNLCRALTDQPYQKIMLTGEADQALAVAGFNEGVIDQFIMKSQTDALKQLQTLSQKAENQFFIDRTLPLTLSLLKFCPGRFDYFLDAAFSEKLQSLFQEYKIKEG